MSRPRVLLIADGGPEVGGGHVMRMLTLAGALAAEGAQPVLNAPARAAPVISAFAPPGLEVRLGPCEEASDADVVVFDHFGLSAEEHRRLAAGRPSAAVDDLADRPMGVDLIVDPGPDRTAEDYAASGHARRLLGADHALVRPEFAAARPAALARRNEAPSARRVLVSLGLTDVEGITRRAMEALLPALALNTAVDAVVGPGAPSLDWLQRTAAADPRLAVQAPARDMVALTAGADLVIGAGGSSVFERCVLGAPSVLLVLADNQLPNARALERRGAALVIDARRPGSETALVQATTSLLADTAARRSVSEAAAAICDGQGAARVARAVLSLLA